MTGFENYKQHLDYIEDDASLHAFNLKDQDGLPKGLKEKIDVFLLAERELKDALKVCGVHRRKK